MCKTTLPQKLMDVPLTMSLRGGGGGGTGGMGRQFSGARNILALCKNFLTLKIRMTIVESSSLILSLCATVFPAVLPNAP